MLYWARPGSTVLSLHLAQGRGGGDQKGEEPDEERHFPLGSEMPLVVHGCHLLTEVSGRNLVLSFIAGDWC